MKKPNKNQDTELLLTPPKKLNKDLFSPTVYQLSAFHHLSMSFYGLNYSLANTILAYQANPILFSCHYV